jgi:hypothetical protein
MLVKILERLHTQPEYRFEQSLANAARQMVGLDPQCGVRVKSIAARHPELIRILSIPKDQRTGQDLQIFDNVITPAILDILRNAEMVFLRAR